MMVGESDDVCMRRGGGGAEVVDLGSAAGRGLVAVADWLSTYLDTLLLYATGCLVTCMERRTESFDKENEFTASCRRCLGGNTQSELSQDMGRYSHPCEAS